MAANADDRAPLLPRHADDVIIVTDAETDEATKTPANESWGGTASIPSASFNMTNTMLGAGIMALPYAMKTMVSVHLILHQSRVPLTLRCQSGALSILVLNFTNI